jgi:hypothetical protein
MILNSLLSDEEKKASLETSVKPVPDRFGTVEYKRSEAQLKKYTKMLELEKNQEALARIQTKEFQNVLRRYYKSRPQFLKDGSFLEDKHFNMMSSTELLHYFYNDRTWRNNNTLALSRDVYDLGTGTDQDLSDWAIINQTFVDLPNFWNDPNRTFYNWAKDFIPALVADPVNFVGVYVGGVAAREALKAGIKVGVKQLTKKELSKLAVKKGIVKGAKYEAMIGGGVSAGFDALHQSNEVTAGLSTKYDLRRTLIAAGIGVGVGGTLGAGFGAFGAKRSIGKFYKNIDGEIIDADHLVSIASKIEDGWVVGKNGKVQKSKPNKKENPEGWIKSKIDELKPDETPIIKKKGTKVDREVDEFFNDKTIKGKDAIETLKNSFRKILQTKDKDFRLDRRNLKDILKKIELKAKIDISKKTRTEILDEADIFNQVGTQIGVNGVALRILQLVEVSRLRKMQEIFDGATTNKEKILAEINVDKAWAKWHEVSEKLDKLRTHVSDNLTSFKVRIETDQAKKLTIKYANTVKKILADYKEKGVDVSMRRIVKRNLLRNITNENRMNKIIQKADMSSVEGRARFGDWLNEYTTANLLFDATTHMINILSGMVKFQYNIILGYNRSLIMMPKHRKMAIQQSQMVTHMFVSQFRFYNIALKKARQAFWEGRALGDELQHKFDARKWRAMDTFTDQVEKETATSVAVTKPMSWIAKLVYNSYKGLLAGDTFMKQSFNRAARVAHVNHRMKTQRPDLWNNSKKGFLGSKLNAIKEDQNIKHLELLIRYEKRNLNESKWNKKKITAYETERNRLLEIIKEKDKDEFTRVWKEWFNQYEDEFGNFIGTKEMSKEIVETFDDLTKSILFDPQYTARESTFTNPLRSDLVPDATDWTGNTDGFAGQLLRTANNHPILRVMAGLHFLKVPAHLGRFSWHSVPMLNKLHFQFKAMENSPDPIIRAHARAITYTATAVFGIAGTLAMQDRLIGGKHPEPEKRWSIRLTDADGKERYVNYNRLYPLSIPFMITAGINDMVREMPNIWNDTQHTEAHQKFNELAVFMGKSAFSLFSSAVSANLMTSEMFTKLESLFNATTGFSEASEEHGWSKLKRIWGKDLLKLIPVATGWRWANKELAEADAEVRTLKEKFFHSTPVEILRILVPEKWEKLLHSFQPKRDPNGNIKYKVEGVDILGLNNLDTPFKISESWIDTVLQTDDGKKLFESLDLVYKPHIGTVTKNNRTLGNLNDFVVKNYVDYNHGVVMSDGDYILDADGNAQIFINTYDKADYVKSLYDSEKFKKMTKVEATKAIIKEIINKKHPNLKLRIFKKGEQTFQDLVSEVKSTMRIDGLTLNERFRVMFDNPQSEFQKSMRWEKTEDGKFVYRGYNVGGKNPEAQRVLDIIRIYETAAKEWVTYKAYNGKEEGEFPILYEIQLKMAEKELFLAIKYQKISEERIRYLNSRTNGGD